ncbi:MAG TPA: RNA polymerase sigma factor FliA [Acidiferrobacteraceae bacterium]|nr:RNA polymerase sigma factor FliA [Acidiferrobacteraceae bacterium]
MSVLASYAQTPIGSPDDLVVRHAPLVKRIAGHLLGRLPSSVQADDLVQAGLIGLLEAARNYDANHGASFETYAGIRIRGAMLDEIRRNNWAPRSVFRKARQVSDAMRKVENRLGRDAHDYEVAEELGVPISDYHRLLQQARGHNLFSIDDVGEGDLVQEGGPSPLENLQKHDFKRSLAKAIGCLPEREQLVLSLYYDEELNLREIGEVLGVSESRVSQIHSQAVLRLQSRMSTWLAV